MALGGLNILPKHVFEKQDFNKINFEFPVVSGPYKLVKLKKGFLSRLNAGATGGLVLQNVFRIPVIFRLLLLNSLKSGKMHLKRLRKD